MGRIDWFLCSTRQNSWAQCPHNDPSLNCHFCQNSRGKVNLLRQMLHCFLNIDCWWSLLFVDFLDFNRWSPSFRQNLGAGPGPDLGAQHADHHEQTWLHHGDQCPRIWSSHSLRQGVKIWQVDLCYHLACLILLNLCLFQRLIKKN